VDEKFKFVTTCVIFKLNGKFIVKLCVISHIYFFIFLLSIFNVLLKN
jgi:hypothetical protein